MYVAELPEKEMKEYKDHFGAIPALMDIDDNVGKEDLVARIKKALEEKEPIPEDDPIYMEISGNKIY